MKTKELVDAERLFLQEFMMRLQREPTSEEIVRRAASLATEEIKEMKQLINEMFISGSHLTLSQQTIVKEMQEICKSSIQRFEHLVHRNYTKQEFENLPETARADLRRVLEQRRQYFHDLIERHGKY
ncbi:hypothetical protein ACQR3P_28995 [Rhodococcus sp. IEGM1300]